MSESLFDYENRVFREEVLYLLRQLADYQSIIPFADKDRRRHVDPDWDGCVSEDPHSFLEAVLAEDAARVETPAEAKTSQVIQYAKFDPWCRDYADDRNYFGDLVEKDPNDTTARAKLDEAKSRGMHRNRAIGKMIKAGTARYFPWTFEAEFNLDGTWVPWRPEFCPRTEIKKRRSRKSK
jgi:hypothetical protein